jgi:hypothetical protein
VKKCLYCGKENEDEAIICHYCWHELPQTIPASQSVKTKGSIWATGAKWAALITILAALGMMIGYFRSLHEILGSLAIGAILSFIFLLLVCTLITWRWRKAGKRRVLEIVIIVFVILVWVTLSVIAEILLNPAPKINLFTPVTPTVTSTRLPPTPNPLGNCNPWNSITSSQVGNIYCIYGRVYEFGGTVILFSKDNSQVRIIYRPVGTYISLHKGDCIVASGMITTENGLLMMTTSELAYCPPGFNP